MVERLRADHRNFRLELIQIEEVSDFSWQKAIEMLKKIRKPILQHAVEEEARIVRVIMQKAKDESEESIRVMQEHKGIIEFLDKRNPQLGSSQVGEEIKHFSDSMRKHFLEEEEIVFPLARFLHGWSICTSADKC
jgi:iron-sulfur cluster repair protein YtfE (RIC family)